MSELIEKRFQSKQNIINKLCILMMVSDRKITDEEIIAVVEIIESTAYFEVTDKQILDLLDSVDAERKEFGIPAMINKYASLIKNKKQQEDIIKHLEIVMNADGIQHPKELEMLKLLKNIWNN